MYMYVCICIFVASSKGYFIELEDISLFSGDEVNLISNNGEYLTAIEYKEYKKYFLSAHAKSLDEAWFTFVVAVVGPNKVTLRSVANNLFLKRFQSGGPGTNLIAAFHLVPDPWSYFTVEKARGNTIRLRSDDGSYWNNDDRQAVHTTVSEPNASCDIQVVKRGTGCEDTVLKINFHREPCSLSSSPEVVDRKEIINNTPVTQVHRIEFKMAVNDSRTFTWGHHFTLSTGTTLKAGVPSVVSGETEISGEAGYNMGGSDTVTATRKFNVLLIFHYHLKSKKPTCRLLRVRAQITILGFYSQRNRLIHLQQNIYLENYNSLQEVQTVTCPPNTTTLTDAVVTRGVLGVKYNAEVKRVCKDGQGQETLFEYNIPGLFKSSETYDYKVVLL